MRKPWRLYSNIASSLLTRQGNRTMRCFRFVSTAIFLVMAILPCALRAEDVPKAGTAKKIQVLVLVGGHGFTEKPFHEVFDSFSDMKCTFVEEKVGGEAFDNIDNWPYDAIVLYNFEKKPSEKERENFLKLFDRGVGLVVLHHGLHGYREWPEFQKIAGITSFVDNAKDDVDYKIHIEDPKHPIVKGMQDFAVKDETYLGHKSIPPPRSTSFSRPTSPTNLKAIAWTHTYRKSPVCFLQLGHDTRFMGRRSTAPFSATPSAGPPDGFLRRGARRARNRSRAGRVAVILIRASVILSAAKDLRRIAHRHEILAALRMTIIRHWSCHLRDDHVVAVDDFVVGAIAQHAGDLFGLLAANSARLPRRCSWSVRGRTRRRRDRRAPRRRL